MDAWRRGLYHTSTVPFRLLFAASVVSLAGCLPEPTRPGSRFDSGPPISFDVLRVEVAPVDRPPVDRPVALDAGFDAPEAANDRPAAPGDGPDPARRYPPGPYGTLMGAVVEPFELADCSGATYRFNGPDWVPARATVMELTAGYCADCVDLARRMQNDIVIPYRPRGVRVVGVLVDGASPGDPPTPTFCQQWVFQGGISHPMALDLGSALRDFTTGFPLPQWVLTDENGRIRWRAQGTAAAVATLRAQLDALLGSP